MEEYRSADIEGKIPLSHDEYKALRTIFGAYNALMLYHDRLERRCRGYKDGWRDLRCLVAMSEKVMHQVLATIPAKKLLQIRKELDNTICEIKVKLVSGKAADGFMYVDEDALIRICKAATDINCFGCEKTHKQARHNCQLYKDIQSFFNYEFKDCGKCPFSDFGAS